MKPSDKDIKNFFKNAAIGTNPRMEETILNKVLSAGQKAINSNKIIHPNIWRIIMKSKLTKLAASVVIAVAVLIGIHVFNGATAWAQIVHAFGQVDAHIDLHVSRDGHNQRRQYWIRRPNYFRRQSNGEIIIDDGQQRLNIYTDQKEAQLSESWQPFHPMDEDPEFEIFKLVNLLRDENMLQRYKIELTMLDSESEENVIVYRIDGWEGHPDGKMWVDSRTMLPKRILLQGQTLSIDRQAMLRDRRIRRERASKIRDESELHELYSLRKKFRKQKLYEKSQEYIFDYQPMSDDFFSVAIPEGYTELPRDTGCHESGWGL
ncbi:MAG: hypothetical protein ACYSWP_24695 [Planctomycetota bacterium]